MSHLRQNSSYWSLLLVLVVAFALAGCGDDESNPTCDPSCDANACMTCQDGTCVSTCTAGQTCNAGTCVDDTTCDPACDANLCMACVDGTCESTCTAGQICDAGTCVADTTCTAGETRCEENVVQTCAADTWTVTTDCTTTGQTCQVDNGVAQCQGGVTCTDGDTRCETNWVETCANNTWEQTEDCDTDTCVIDTGVAVCQAPIECIPGCDAAQCMECDTLVGECVTSCTEGQTCDGAGNCVADTTCTPACVENDCMICDNGTCVTSCTADQTCDGAGNCVADSVCEPACIAEDCMACVNGTCESTCTLGQVCDGAGNCVADTSCTPACDAAMCMVCSDSTCVTSCTAGQTCDGAGACVCESMTDLRAQADGPLDTPLQICPAYVTYLTNTGFFLQTDPDGPAIYAFEGWDWNVDNLLAVGDYITMPVTELTTYFGLKEITDHGDIEVITTGNSIDSLIQDLSAGTVPSEDLESEIVSLTEATITAIDGSDLTVDYGTATGVEIHAGELDGAFCVGATFDFLGLGADNNGAYNLRSFYVTDFSSINTDNCPDLGRAPVDGDLVLNEFLADPPNGPSGDANCDGTRGTTDDEFVEIVNVSGDVLDLSGVTIDDAANDTSVRHTFLGISLPAGGVIVVFGGGNLDCNWEANVQAVTASDGKLELNNGGDTITIADNAGTALITYTYGNEGGDNESLTLSPDLDTANPYVGHSTADTVDASLFSPGTAIDGSALAP